MPGWNPWAVLSNRIRAAVVPLGLAVALVVAPVVVPAAGGFTVAWPSCTPRSEPIHLGLKVEHKKKVTTRVTDYTFHSRAMQGDVHADILLPKHYDPSGATRYPVMYLLHGAFGSHADWVDHGVEAMMGNRRYVVVMPDDNPNGSYTDWYGLETAFDTGPVPAWESFHMRELLPWVDSHFAVRHDRMGRVIAGLSSGGYGATKYAAQFPGTFGAVGEFSGAVDINLPDYHGTSEATWDTTYLPGMGPPGHCTWGDPNVHPINWYDGDATALASNLRGTALFLASGNGDDGPYDPPTKGPDAVELVVHQMNLKFDAALAHFGIPHSTYFYGPGTHSWPYWTRDLRHFLRWLPVHLRKVRHAPASFSIRDAVVPFSAWGWTFTPHRKVAEFTYLRHVSTAGLTVIGSGRLHVVTPPSYRPGGRYLVSVGRHYRTVSADGAGRLRFTVGLGPSHGAEQQVHLGNSRPPAAWLRGHVRITERVQ